MLAVDLDVAEPLAVGCVGWPGFVCFDLHKDVEEVGKGEDL
jgi:hypothetical protein